ncbi:MAG TPA: class I SAM-dependent methyltransferase [Burkholderiales bacterium]|nr:class I SAM-dependent methyltransferase [Burkholderiales bacterium]
MLPLNPAPALTRLAAMLLFASGAVAYAHRAPGDAADRSGEADEPGRDAWQRPAAVIRALAPARDAVVADIGAGSGYFSVRLARALPRGRVIAVDTDPRLVRCLAQRAQREGLSNLSAQPGDAEEPALSCKVDLALLVDTYRCIRHRERYFRGVRTALRPGGRLAIIDFRADAPLGPPLRARVAAQTAIAELAQAGFELRRQHHFLPYQHFLLLAAARP